MLAGLKEPARMVVHHSSRAEWTPRTSQVMTGVRDTTSQRCFAIETHISS